MDEYTKIAWDDVSNTKEQIDRRTTNLIHLTSGSYRYDFVKFNYDSYAAVMADYEENPTDEQLRKSLGIIYSEERELAYMVEWFKKNRLK